MPRCSRSTMPACGCWPPCAASWPPDAAAAAAPRWPKTTSTSACWNSASSTPARRANSRWPPQQLLQRQRAAARRGTRDRQPRPDGAASAARRGALHAADRRSQHHRRAPGHRRGRRFSPPRSGRRRRRRTADAGVSRRGVRRCPGELRAVVNIGGIANVTLLRPTAASSASTPARAIACSMPGRAGTSATPTMPTAPGPPAARCRPALLSRLLSEPYFARPPPKSTGRETFSDDWLDRALTGLAPAAADVQATLSELTALTIADVSAGRRRPRSHAAC